LAAAAESELTHPLTERQKERGVAADTDLRLAAQIGVLVGARREYRSFVDAPMSQQIVVVQYLHSHTHTPPPHDDISYTSTVLRVETIRIYFLHAYAWPGSV